jgi:pimeloyl-ACP methyl ester carboxylesterase
MEKKFKRQQNVFYFNQSKKANEIEAERLPVTLILGWADSYDNRVRKYSEIYEEFGFHTIRVAPSLRYAAFYVGSHIIQARKLLDLMLNKYKLTKNPIIAHGFSNGGLLIYQRLSEVAHADKRYEFFKDNLKCVVMDSGPGWPLSFAGYVRDSLDVMVPYASNKLLAYFLVYLGTAAFAIRHKFFYPRSNNFITRFFQGLVQDKFNVPTLVYYSKLDRIIDTVVTMRFIEERRKFKPNLYLDAVEFPDTKHVAHFQKYPELYVNRLKQLLQISGVPIYGDEIVRVPIKSKL